MLARNRRSLPSVKMGNHEEATNEPHHREYVAARSRAGLCGLLGNRDMLGG